MAEGLRPVIRVDDEKCVNCHACIAACPVKFCIDGSGDKVRVIHELCIGCGSCIAACTHGAREGIDDFDEFMAALGAGERPVAIVAPAVAARFPDDYLRFNGWLKSAGVEAIFDVSFGAELTVRSYLEYMKEASPPLVIAQPCPAIVNYVEIYQSELLPSLAPADSPMVHAMKMVREYRPDLASRKMAVISPCVAKRREFDATGFGDWNVTLERVVAYFAKAGIALSSFPEIQFDNPPAERAVLFSSPGGLKATVERELPGLGAGIRKIEGPGNVYPYLKELPAALRANAQPALLDCLNCEKGCNGGTGTGSRDSPVDLLEAAIRRRDARQRAAYAAGPLKGGRKRLERNIDRYWRKGLYDRRYRDRSSSRTAKRPSEAEFAAIYARMRKADEDDYLNCSACGYGSCEDMAIAVHNGLNKPENCQHYRQKALAESKGAIADMAVGLDGDFAKSAGTVKAAIDMLPELNALRSRQAASLEASTTMVGRLLARIKDSSRVSEARSQGLAGLLTTAGDVQGRLAASLEAVLSLKERMEAVHGLVSSINDIADRTNLLAMNASIEAAHAGASGKGFAVVAGEIRGLADQAGKSAALITKSLEAMAKDMEGAAGAAERSGSDIKALLSELESNGEGMRGLFGALTAMAEETDEIGEAIAALRAAASSVGETYHRIEKSLNGASEELGELAKGSRESVRRIEEM